MFGGGEGEGGWDERGVGGVMGLEGWPRKGRGWGGEREGK